MKRPSIDGSSVAQPLPSEFGFYEKEAAMSSAVDVPEVLDCTRLAPHACPDAVLDAFDAQLELRLADA